MVDFLWFSCMVNIPFVPWIRHGLWVWMAHYCSFFFCGLIHPGCFLRVWRAGTKATNPQPCNRVEATKFPENARVAIGEFASHQQKFMHPKFGTAKVEVGGSRCLPDRESGQVDILVHVRSSISYGKLKIMHW